MSISERLQKLRKHERYSQEQLAEKLGVTRQAISKWESNQGNPDINNIIKLSEIYNVSTDYLLKGEEQISKPIEIDSEENKENIKSRKMFNILLFIAGISAIAILFLFTFTFLIKTFLGGH
ncbi:helix-turn-helix transcriptional regulator [Clostridium sp. JS66]|uniref:helix-turn-helix domain-containing protein n=1 Tax=Clostridium sp. JS66 TaxID=3064705 RepID=UPI00298EA423|nr:helix-turn-helix transcriptional regulator [Clostridium sp. JS66]WPC42185.1 helix-turn-helix transcriptional regulator [Clostridium sp. JS66]